MSKASAVSMAARVTGLVLAFLSHVLLSRVLGANQYGHYAIALGWAMVLVIPARLGLDNSVLRYATIYREEGRSADFRGLVRFSLAAISIFSLLIAAALLAGKAAGLEPLQGVEMMLLVAIAALIPCSAVLGWLSCLMRTANRIFASQFYEQVLRPTLLIGAILALLLVGRRPDAAAAMLVTASTVGLAMLGLAIHARAAFAGIPPGPTSFEHRREWLSVSWALFLMAATQELLNQADVILLGAMANATEAGHFAAAWRLAALVPFGLVAIVTISAPLIASAHNRGDFGELARIARLSARFSTLFAAAMVLVLSLFGKLVLSLFGDGFDSAYPALIILLVGGLVNSFTGSVGYYLILTGRQRSALAIMIGALLLDVSLNAALIPRLGATGSAVASAVALSFWTLAMAIHVRRTLGIDTTALGLSPIKLTDQ